MDVTARPVDFRVFCLKQTKVYRYEESHSRAQLVGKFFVNGSHHGPVAMERMRQEFENLQVLRGYGLAGYQARKDGVHGHVGQPLFGCQDIGNADHATRSILDADDQYAAGRVRKRHQRLQEAVWRGEVPLVLDGLALPPLKQRN